MKIVQTLRGLGMGEQMLPFSFKCSSFLSISSLSLWYVVKLIMCFFNDMKLKKFFLVIFLVFDSYILCLILILN